MFDNWPNVNLETGTYTFDPKAFETKDTKGEHIKSFSIDVWKNEKQTETTHFNYFGFNMDDVKFVTDSLSGNNSAVIS